MGSVEVIAVMGEGIIEFTPTPIVRCRDCISCSVHEDPYGERPDASYCELLGLWTMSDGYCHRGRRAEHGADR